MNVEYKVRPIIRYVVTRHYQSSGVGLGVTGGSETKGEYDNADVAYEVAYALCKSEHASLGYPLDDERIKYPDRIEPDASTKKLRSLMGERQANPE